MEHHAASVKEAVKKKQTAEMRANLSFLFARGENVCE